MISYCLFYRFSWMIMFKAAKNNVTFKIPSSPLHTTSSLGRHSTSIVLSRWQQGVVSFSFSAAVLSSSWTQISYAWRVTGDQLYERTEGKILSNFSQNNLHYALILIYRKHVARVSQPYFFYYELAIVDISKFECVVLTFIFQWIFTEFTQYSLAKI